MTELKAAKIKDIPTRLASFELLIVRIALIIVVIVLAGAIACGGGFLLVMAAMTVFAAVPAVGVLLVHAMSLTLTMETFLGTMRLILCCLGCAFGGVILLMVALYVLRTPVEYIERIRMKTNTPHLDTLIDTVGKQVEEEQELYRHLCDKTFDEIRAAGLDLISTGGQLCGWQICTPEQRAILIHSPKYADWRRECQSAD